MNNAGQEVFVPRQTDNNLVTFNASALSEGIYYVRIETEKGVEMKKIVLL